MVNEESCVLNLLTAPNKKILVRGFIKLTSNINLLPLKKNNHYLFNIKRVNA